MNETICCVKVKEPGTGRYKWVDRDGGLTADKSKARTFGPDVAFDRLEVVAASCRGCKVVLVNRDTGEVLAEG
jgi:hypothetical protein